MKLSDDEIRALAEAGGAAPTGGNMQAWRLSARADTLAIYLDPDRSSAFIDVDRAGSLLGLGSFTENVRIEALSRGLVPAIDVHGLSSLDAPVVTMRLSRGEPVGDVPSGAIRTRATNRRPWNGETIDGEAIARLAAATTDDTTEEGSSRLVTAAGEDKPRVAEALAEADVVRTFNRAYHEGMLDELRWTPEEVESTRDGLDVETLELADGDKKGLSLMRKRWFVSIFVTKNRVRAMGRAGLLASSHLCAVTMPKEATSAQIVEAGRAVQRMWLRATEEGLAIQPWCTIPFFALRAERHPDTLPPKDVERIGAIDAELRDAWGLRDDERLAFTFRLSIPDGPPSALALRRAWSEYTTIEG